MINKAEEVKEVISEYLGVIKETVNLKSRFNEDLGLDSLDFVELLIEIERKFGISIPDEVCSDFIIVNDLVNYVNNAF